MRIGFFADGKWAHRAMDLILDSPQLQVVFIVARFDKPDLVLKGYAKRIKCPFLLHRNVNSPDFLESIRQYSPDLNVSMSFNQILKKAIIRSAPKGFINCHAGALPFYRGRNVLNWALINGETRFGVAVHYIDEGIDTGDIILQRFAEIEPKDDYASLLNRAVTLCGQTLHEALILIETGGAEIIKQNSINPVGFYCGRRINGDEHLDWNWPSERIYNFVRAITIPGPGARTYLGEKEIAILQAELISGEIAYISTHGEVVGKDDMGIVVKTGDSSIRVKKIANVAGDGTIEEAIIPNFSIGNRFGLNIQSKIKRMENRIERLERILAAFRGGGHARVLIDALKCSQREIIGITDPDISIHGRKVMGIPVIGDDTAVKQYTQDSVKLINGIGSVRSTSRRRLLFDRFKNQGYSFATIIHPSAVIAWDVEISEGAQIMAGAIVQTGCHIGQNSIVNTGASVDHDCQIGVHCHLSPGVILSGDVSVGDGTHIGTGAVIIQGIDVGSNCLVAAGSVVVRRIGNKIKVKGVPAKEA